MYVVYDIKKSVMKIWAAMLFRYVNYLFNKKLIVSFLSNLNNTKNPYILSWVSRVFILVIFILTQ